MDKYAVALAQINYRKPNLPNVDFDTGSKTEYGEYVLTDKTYDELVDKLVQNKFVNLTLPLKQNIINFYNKADTTALAKYNPTDWKKTSVGLQQIKTAHLVPLDSLKATPISGEKAITNKGS